MLSRYYYILLLCVCPDLADQKSIESPMDSVSQLVENLKSWDDLVADKASHDLAALSKKDKEVAIPLIIKTLKDVSGDSRFGLANRCLQGMGLLSLPFLIEASTNDKDAGVRLAATDVLGQCLFSLCVYKNATEEEIKPGIAALIKAMGDKSERVRRYAAGSIGDRLAHFPSCDEAIPPLIRLVKNDPDRYVRNSAARALGWFGVKAVKAIPALIGALKESLPEDEAYGHLGRSAAISLARIGVDSLPPLIEVVQSKKVSLEARKEALWSLEQQSDQVVRKGLTGSVLPILTKLLRDPDPSIRIRTLQALSQYGPAAKVALPALEQLVKKDSTEVRIWGAGTLYFVDPKNQTSIPLLVALLKQNRLGLLSLLQSVGDKHVLNSLALPWKVHFILKENERIAHLVCGQLAAIGPDAVAAVPILIELLADECENTNNVAINTLRYIGKPAIPALTIAIMNPDKKVSDNAKSALSMIE
jgi:HEAT repeat protein